jgi:Thiol-disulfide isomerase and thioredoxins
MRTKRAFSMLLATVLLLFAATGMAQIVSFGSFSAKDLRSEDVITEEYFQEADVTLVNFWTTWCGPCIAELPDLAKLAELSEGQVQVLGVLLDGLDMKGEEDKKTVEAMHVLLDNAEAEYPTVLPDSWLMQIGSLANVVPTTFLIDSEGNIIEVVTGARSAEQWLKLIAGITGE